MSSYVAKSKKSFQPKAPARRAASAASNTPSVRGSQEPFRVSETPQPSSAREHAATVVSSDKVIETSNLDALSHDAQQTALDVVPAGRASRTPSSTTGTPAAAQTVNNPTQAQNATPAVVLAPVDSQEPPPETTALAEDVVSPRRGKRKNTVAGNKSVEKGQSESLTTHGNASSTIPTSTQVQQLPTPPVTQIPPSSSQEVATQQPSQEDGANALLQLSQADARSGDARITPTGSQVGTTRSTKRTRAAATRNRAPAAKSSVADTVSEPLTKATRGRKRKSAPQEELYPEDNVAEARPAKKSRAKPISSKPRTKKATAHTAEDEDAAAVAAANKPRQRRKRARDIPETAAGEDVSGSSSEEQVHKRRERTPEDAEEQRIDQTEQTMADLPELRIGKLGARERLLRERDAKEEAQKAVDAEIAARIDEYGECGVPEEDQEAHDYLERQREKEEKEQAEQAEKERVFEEQQEWTNLAPKRGTKRPIDEESEGEVEAVEDDYAENGENGQYVVVGGQAVLNTTYQVKQKKKNVKITERQETDISRRTNYGTGSRKEVRFRWTEEALEMFWEGLQTFGTSLDMIATMIPGASRRNIKKQYDKEMKYNEAAVNEALSPSSRLKGSQTRIEGLRGKPLVDTEKFYAESEKKEAALRQDKEQARQEAEAELRGGVQVEDAEQDGGNDEGGEVERKEVEAPASDGASENEEQPDEGAEETTDQPTTYNNAIEDLDDDGVVHSIESEVAEAAASKRGARGRGSRATGRGRGRGGRARGRRARA